MPNPTRSDILKHKNDTLAAQVDVQRKELNDLGRKLEKAEEREDALKETLLVINDLWEELNSSIAFLRYRTGNTEADTLLKATEDSRASEEGTLHAANPFLAKLLSSFSHNDASARTAGEIIAQDQSLLEETLRKRMKATLEGATAVLESVEAIRAGSIKVGQGMQPCQEREDKLLASNTVLKAANDRLRSQAMLDELKIRELTNRLADNEDELLVAQRKLGQARVATLKQAAPGRNESLTTEAPVNEILVDNGELAQLHDLLEKRTAEADQKEVNLIRAERDLRGLRDQLASQIESAKRARENEAHRNRKQITEFEGLAASIREVQRERDELLSRLRDFHMKLDGMHHSERRLKSAEATISDLERRLSDSRSARHDAEQLLDRERAKTREIATADDIQRLFEDHKKQINTLKVNCARFKEAADAASDASRRAQLAEQALAERDSQVKLLEERLIAARAIANKQQALKDKESELLLFMELAKSVGFDGEKVANDTSVVAVQKVLNERIKNLQDQLSAANAAADTLQQRAEAAEDQIAELRTRCAQLEQQVKSAEQNVAKVREENEHLLGELDGVMAAFEDAQDKGAKLAEQLRRQQEANAKLLADVSSADRERSALAQMRSEVVADKARAEDTIAQLKQRLSEVQEFSRKLQLDVGTAKENAHAMAEKLDVAVMDLKERDAIALAASKEADAARVELLNRTKERDDAIDEIRQVRTRAERLQDEVRSLQSRLERMGASPEGLAAELQQECDALRQLINCSVCCKRQKDRIITKCNHIFCNSCIKANLDSRSRKCPGCGTGFGANDVKEFFFT